MNISPGVSASIMKYRDVLENYECSMILGKAPDPRLLDMAKIEIAEAVLRHAGITSCASDSRIRAELAELERIGEAQRVVRPHIPTWLRWKIYRRDHYRCVDCHKHWDLSVDHIVPVSKGGATVIENLATRCRPCNSKKGANVV